MRVIHDETAIRERGFVPRLVNLYLSIRKCLAVNSGFVVYRKVNT